MQRRARLAALVLFVGGTVPVGIANAAEPAAGDVYVTVTGSGGGVIFIDGATTGVSAPGMVRGVAIGPHSVRVDDGCRTATADLSVRANAIERLNVDLQVGLSTISVVTDPAGATVTEGEKTLGIAPFGPVVLPCGSHTVVTSAPGRQALPYTFEVPLRGHLDVKIDLPPAALGAVAVTPSPLEAEIWVDGSDRGAGPMTVENLSPGVHTIGARLDGYLPGEEQVTVVTDQILRTSIALVAKPTPAELRAKRARTPWARIGVDAGVTLGSVALGVLAWSQYSDAVANYATYQTLTYQDGPDAFYASEVEAPRTLSYVLASLTAAGTATSGVLWATTRPKPAAVPPPVAAGSLTPMGMAGADTVAVSADTFASERPVLDLTIAPAPLGLTLTGRF
jgi:hypothetical protein